MDTGDSASDDPTIEAGRVGADRPPDDGNGSADTSRRGPGPSEVHSHGHGHGHGLEGSWERWLGVPVLRVILAGVAAVGLAAIVGLVALWPDGSGRTAAIEEATALGLNTEQFDATVETALEAECSYSTPDDPQNCRSYSLVVHEGPDAGSVIALPEYNLTIGAPAPTLAVGDPVVVGYEPTTAYYFYADRDRGSILIWLTVAFAAVVVALARWRGFAALVAMLATLVALVGFVAPSVLDGNDPVLVAAVAGVAIAFVSLYLTHGFNPTTTVALAGTLASLVLTLVVSALFFDLAAFSGLATEEGLTLPLLADVDVSSLLLAGAVIGALGALDDITVTQVAAVAELHHRNDKLTVAELIASGVRVGREHIASVVNTLLLAYAGASMPLLLLFAASDQPLGVVANSETVAVEIVRTLSGSIGLVAAVPITTVMAALLVGSLPVAGEGSADEATGPGPGIGPDEGGRASMPVPEHRSVEAGARRPATAGAPSPAGAGDGGKPDRQIESAEPVEAPKPKATWDDFAPREDDAF